MLTSNKANNIRVKNKLNTYDFIITKESYKPFFWKVLFFWVLRMKRVRSLRK
jgi:hypothetical protein